MCCIVNTSFFLADYINYTAKAKGKHVKNKTKQRTTKGANSLYPYLHNCWTNRRINQSVPQCVQWSEMS